MRATIETKVIELCGNVFAPLPSKSAVNIPKDVTFAANNTDSEKDPLE